MYSKIKYHDDWPFKASRKMLDAVGVKYWQHKPKHNKIIIDFTAIENSSPKNSEEYQKQQIETTSAINK